MQTGYPKTHLPAAYDLIGNYSLRWLDAHCGAERNIHSRQIASNAAMMTGPTKRPVKPNAARPPKMPTNASRKGSLAEPLTKVGQMKWSPASMTTVPQTKTPTADVDRSI